MTRMRVLPSGALVQLNITNLVRHNRLSRLFGVDLLRFPQPAAFHAARYDDGLTGNVPCQRIGDQEDRRMGDIVRAAELRQCHGGRHLPNGGGITQLRCGSRHQSPTWADAVDATAAVGPRVRRQAGHFVLQRAS